jgi:ribosomal protein S18 acetylase RimI-like enzyme
MSRAEQVSREELADANLIESIREHARWQASGELIEENGLLLFAGSTSYPGAYRNCAVRLERGLAAEDAVRRARDFFGARGRGFTLWVRSGRDDDLDSLAESSGMQRVADGPCMLVDAPLSLRNPPPAVRTERFTQESHVRDAIVINAEAYALLGLAPEETHATFPEPARLLSDRVVGFVAYRADGPVAAALTLLHGQSAGVYWVGTAVRAQRIGLGGLCTTLATNAAFERGARVVMLQASPFGAPLYARLGYTTYGRARWYRTTSG